MKPAARMMPYTLHALGLLLNRAVSHWHPQKDVSQWRIWAGQAPAMSVAETPSTSASSVPVGMSHCCQTNTACASAFLNKRQKCMHRLDGLHCLCVQALGLSPEAVRANLPPSLNTFMPQGDLETLLAGETEQPPILVATNSPAQPVTVTADTYRLPLLAGTKAEVRSCGSNDACHSTSGLDLVLIFGSIWTLKTIWISNEGWELPIESPFFSSACAWGCSQHT